MSRQLDPLEDIGDLDTVRVVWPSYDLVVWSRERPEWINLLFELMNPDEEPAELPVLHDAGPSVLDRHGPYRPVAMLVHGNLSGGGPRILVAAFAVLREIASIGSFDVGDRGRTFRRPLLPWAWIR